VGPVEGEDVTKVERIGWVGSVGAAGTGQVLGGTISQSFERGSCSLQRHAEQDHTTGKRKCYPRLPSVIERHVTTGAGHQIGGTAGSTKDLLDGVETAVGRSTGRGQQ
jgi:hypothetical protein